MTWLGVSERFLVMLLIDGLACWGRPRLHPLSSAMGKADSRKRWEEREGNSYGNKSLCKTNNSFPFHL